MNTLFQHRHYVRLAKFFDQRGGFTVQQIQAMADMLQDDNPRFDRDRFITAA